MPDAAIRELDDIYCKRQVDNYGLALMMIREGCANPADVARKVLNKIPERLSIRNFSTNHDMIVVATAALSHAFLEHAVSDANDAKADDLLEHAVRTFALDYAAFAGKAGLHYRLKMVK